MTLKHSKIHAEDCAECETKAGMLDQIDRVISMEGALDAEQRGKLMEIADKCPVHRTLTSEICISDGRRRLTTIKAAGSRGRATSRRPRQRRALASSSG